MSHPFEVGKHYRNRNGEYVVQAIEGDWMKIRYVSGGTLETRIGLQTRIWENIQFEEQMAREEERARLAREARLVARKRSAKRGPAKPEYAGFQESDFEPKKRGIAWSGREQLGKALAHELAQRIRGGFDSWIVPRKSEVQVGRREHYSQDSRETNASFFVAANDEGLTYGFRVGKPDGKVRPQWPWSVFVAALLDNDKLRRALRAAMKKHDLSLDVYAMDLSYGQVGQVTVQARGFLWTHETADQEMTKRLNWDELVDTLRTRAANKRCDLFLRTRMPAKEALKAKAEIAAQVATVFQSLILVYDVSVGA